MKIQIPRPILFRLISLVDLYPGISKLSLSLTRKYLNNLLVHQTCSWCFLYLNVRRIAYHYWNVLHWFIWPRRMTNIYIGKIEHVTVVLQENFLPIWVKLGQIIMIFRSNNSILAVSILARKLLWSTEWNGKEVSTLWKHVNTLSVTRGDRR